MDFDPQIKQVLPHGTMYTIQIGNERFVLSGASLSSDSPSYFTNYYLNSANKDKVLFIDRSPTIFKYIYNHLQGYYFDIADATDFTQIFTDVLYYNLPNLLHLLKNNDYYYAIVGGQSIKFPKKLLSHPLNQPNFFSVSNDAIFQDLTGLLIKKKWIRPPPQSAPVVHRNYQLLRELIDILEGVDIEIKSPNHRNSLIKEAKYYRFNSIIPKLVDYRIIFNPFIKQNELLLHFNHLEVQNLILHNTRIRHPTSDGTELDLICQFSDYKVTLNDDETVTFTGMSKMRKIKEKFDHSNQPDQKKDHEDEQLDENTVIIPLLSSEGFNIKLKNRNNEIITKVEQLKEWGYSKLYLSKVLVQFNVSENRLLVNILKGEGLDEFVADFHEFTDYL